MRGAWDATVWPEKKKKREERTRKNCGKESTFPIDPAARLTDRYTQKVP